MTPESQVLIERFKNKNARIGIFGLGYVGLPLAVTFAEAGFTVTGVDPDEKRLKRSHRSMDSELSALKILVSREGGKPAWRKISMSYEVSPEKGKPYASMPARRGIRSSTQRYQ